MNLKKNAVSYVTWMIILLFTGATVSFWGMMAAQTLNVNIIVAASGCIFVFFGILFLIYTMIGYMTQMWPVHQTPVFLMFHAATLEKILVVFCFIIGIGFRIYFLPTAGEDAAYYEVSKVTQQSGILVQSVQGSVYYYCMLLHGLFLLFGNHWIAGVILQIILQIAGTIIYYFVVRKLLGVCPALLTLMYILFAPSSISAGLTYSPQMLYFCIFTAAMLAFADFITRSLVEEEYPIAMWFYAGFVGMLIGICTYIDVTGVLLLVLSIYLFMIKRENFERKLCLLRFALIAVTAVLAFMLMILLDGILSGSVFGRVLNAWFVTYGSVQPTFEIITNNVTIDFFVILLLVSLGAFSFWRRKYEERFTPWVFICTGIAILHFGGFLTENMSGSYLMYVLFTVLASVSVTELFCVDTEQEKVVKKEEPEVIDLEKTPEPAEGEKEKKPRFIENPLPLPKRHARKAMDYAIVPKENEMKYDVSVSDSDDYDI